MTKKRPQLQNAQKCHRLHLFLENVLEILCDEIIKFLPQNWWKFEDTSSIFLVKIGDILLKIRNGHNLF